jgi:hypothetical protein
MADPITWAVLGGVAATEGIKFLYGQAAELLKAWRERRARVAAGVPENTGLTVPIVDNTVLDGAPTEASVDPTVMEREADAMARLYGVLTPYAQGMVDPRADDEELPRQAAQLRALLEAAYGQRLTFRGEHREPTGTRVTISQVIGELEGRVHGGDLDIEGSSVDVTQDVKVVRPSGVVEGPRARIRP